MRKTMTMMYIEQMLKHRNKLVRIEWSFKRRTEKYERRTRIIIVNRIAKIVRRNNGNIHEWLNWMNESVRLEILGWWRYSDGIKGEVKDEIFDVNLFIDLKKTTEYPRQTEMRFDWSQKGVFFFCPTYMILLYWRVEQWLTGEKDERERGGKNTPRLFNRASRVFILCWYMFMYCSTLSRCLLPSSSNETNGIDNRCIQIVLLLLLLRCYMTHFLFSRIIWWFSFFFFCFKERKKRIWSCSNR